MRLSRAVLAVALVGLLGSGAASAQTRELPELGPKDVARLKAHVEARPDEERWGRIPWRASFWQAVKEAQAQDRPVLLWAMNGHPLGCT